VLPQPAEISGDVFKSRQDPAQLDFHEKGVATTSDDDEAVRLQELEAAQIPKAAKRGTAEGTREGVDLVDPSLPKQSQRAVQQTAGLPGGLAEPGAQAEEKDRVYGRGTAG
jgi:hypothetical protein